MLIDPLLLNNGAVPIGYQSPPPSLKKIPSICMPLLKLIQTLQDTYCEEMYNLDNDSFLNSLETVAMPTMLWTVAPNSDSDV